ncbi:MAG TPA: hypothetical protein VGS08_05280 [Candidatus Saccharimonadales bacterium]|nr:hypothetical protein [Candidatus Saccharimonadales bacterium]
MIASLIITTVTVFVIVGLGLFWAKRRRRPRILDKRHFKKGWAELQKLCRDKKTWPKALTTADNLLDEALRKRRVGGKNMGERLVKAQHLLSNNDGAWYGHKLRNKLESDSGFRLKESNVKTALVGIRQALKDLGALPNEQPKRK